MAVLPSETVHEQQVKIIDTKVLSDLGAVGHVLFDKTDTLTKGSADLKCLSSSLRNYMVEIPKLAENLQEVVSDPEKYAPVEDQQELLDGSVIERYSEKS